MIVEIGIQHQAMVTGYGNGNANHQMTAALRGGVGVTLLEKRHCLPLNVK